MLASSDVSPPQVAGPRRFRVSRASSSAEWSLPEGVDTVLIYGESWHPSINANRLSTSRALSVVDGGYHTMPEELPSKL
jgi:hypothetical protein